MSISSTIEDVEKKDNKVELRSNDERRDTISEQRTSLITAQQDEGNNKEINGRLRKRKKFWEHTTT